MVGRRGVRIPATRDGLRVEAEGISGPACKGMLDELLRSLGINPGEAWPTQSYWMEHPGVDRRIIGKN